VCGESIFLRWSRREHLEAKPQHGPFDGTCWPVQRDDCPVERAVVGTSIFPLPLLLESVRSRRAVVVAKRHDVGESIFPLSNPRDDRPS
jgi:hypothetical protein